MISAGRIALKPISDDLNCAHPGVTGSVPNLTTESLYAALRQFSDKKELVDALINHVDVLWEPPTGADSYSGGMSSGVDVGAERVCFRDTDIFGNNFSPDWHAPWNASWSDFNYTFSSGLNAGKSIGYQDVGSEWMWATVDYSDEQKYIFDALINKAHMDKWLPSAVFVYGGAFALGKDGKSFSNIFKDAALNTYMTSVNTYLANPENHDPAKRVEKDAKAWTMSNIYPGEWGTGALIMLEAFAGASMTDEVFAPAMQALANASQLEFSKVLSAGRDFNIARDALKQMEDKQKEIDAINNDKTRKVKEAGKVKELKADIELLKLKGQGAIQTMASKLWKTNEDGSLVKEKYDGRDRATLLFTRDLLNRDQDHIVEVMERGYEQLLAIFGKKAPAKTGGGKKKTTPPKKDDGGGGQMINPF